MPSSYTRSLAPADFNGAFFTRAHFQKIAQMPSLHDFQYISEGIPSLMGFWLLMLKCCGFGPCGFLPDLKNRTIKGLGANTDTPEILKYPLPVPDVK